jgi:hypothetical protein
MSAAQDNPSSTHRIDRLAAFAPVERPCDQAELDRRYAAYRAGDYVLTAEATDWFEMSASVTKRPSSNSRPCSSGRE